MTVASVVIPTYRRPQFLARAIDSALQSAPNGDVEVIVVPNGTDDSWVSVAGRYKANTRVAWHPITAAHANAARNHGLSLASGEFIRFLDDDDYLYPTACCDQVLALIEADADISSGCVDVVLSNKRLIKTYRQPETLDFVVSTLTPSRMTLPVGHIYRRTSISDARWEPDRSIRQDTAWLIRLASSREFKWLPFHAAVGAWVQHDGVRTSRGRDPGGKALMETAELLQSAHAELSRNGRLTLERSQAVADGLWSALQKGLQYDLEYWIRIANIADGYAPGRRPPSAIHRIPFVRMLSPLLVELSLVPVRHLYRPARRALERYARHRV